MSRNIKDLDAVVAGKYRSLLKLCKAQAIDIAVTSTLRTEAEQTALFAQGRQCLRLVNQLRADAGLRPLSEEENKRRITNCLTSIHQFGCAFDVAVKEPVEKIVWDVKADVNKNNKSDYEEIGLIGESIGLRWGGRFKLKDYCHFEYTGGLTLLELKAGLRPNKK